MKNLVDYINNLFGLADGNTTATTLIITLFVFLAGFLIKGFFTFISREFRRKAVRKDLKIILETIAESISKQSSNFKEFYESIDMTSIVHRLPSNPISHLKTFNEYTYSEIRYAFLDVLFLIKRFKGRRKDVNHLYELIGLLERNEELYPEDLKEDFVKINKFENDWGSNMEGLQNLYDEGRMIAYEMERGNIPMDKEYYDFIIDANKIWITWAEMDDQLQFKIAKENFIDPLLELNRNHNFKGPINLKSYKFLLGATYAYNNLEVVFDEMKNTFKGYHTNYSNIYRKLTRINTFN